MPGPFFSLVLQYVSHNLLKEGELTTEATQNEPYFAEAEECQKCPYSSPCVTLLPDDQAPRITRPTVFDCVFRGLTLEGSIPKIAK